MRWKNVFIVLHDDEFLAEVGFLAPNEAQGGLVACREDLLLAETFFDLARRLVGEEISFASWLSHRPPFLFVGVHNNKAEYTEIKQNETFMGHAGDLRTACIRRA